MKLSIIIPCFNAADTIAIQLEALANQKWHESWEVIISDNGSTDNSLEIVEQYGDRLHNLRIIDSSARVGAAHARNMGAKAAKGESIVFCDADDEVAPGWLAAMGEALSKHDFVVGALDTTKLSESWAVNSRDFPNMNTELPVHKCAPQLLMGFSGNMGIKRSIHKAIGGFDESFTPSSEDIEYSWRLQLAGTKLKFVPNALVYYRLRHTLLDIYYQAIAYSKGHVRLYKKYQYSGIFSRPLKDNVMSLKWLLINFPKIRSKEEMGRWLWHLGWRVGYWQGRLKFRI